MGEKLRRAILVTLACSLAATACSEPSLAARLASYGDEVAAVVERPGQVEPVLLPGALPDDPHPHYPRRRDRVIETGDHRMSGLDFLAIQGCRLSRLVGERNSPMGRTMVSSRRLIYELDVLSEGSRCLEGQSDERAARLSAILDAKRSELSAHVWNAVWNGEEMEAYLSSTSALGAPGPAAGARGLYEALEVVSRPAANPADGEALEDALEALRRETPAGADIAQLARMTKSLRRVAVLVASQAATACGERERRLASLFETSYLPVQSELAAFDRRAGERLHELDRLYQATAPAIRGAPPAMVAYHRSQLSVDRPEGAWKRYRAAIRSHTSAWEPILTLCRESGRGGGTGASS